MPKFKTYSIANLIRLFSILVSLAATALSVSKVDPINASIEGESTYPYRLYIPSDAIPEKPLPLVLYLHGLGEKGTNNTRQVGKHIQELLNKTQGSDSKFKAIVLAPQSPSGWWSGEHVNQLVDHIELSYPEIDKSREYLIGISAGGGGCYVTLADRPERWAAAAPLSAVRDAESIPKISHIPIWLFHGHTDVTVRSSESIQVFETLIKANCYPRLTLIDDWKHGPWEPIFKDNPTYTANYQGGNKTNTEQGFFAWLFSHHRN